MTQSKSIRVGGSKQAQIDNHDIVTDTGWREVNGIRVLTIVAGDEGSELRRRWVERMSVPAGQEQAA